MFKAQYIILTFCVIVKINCKHFEGYIVGGTVGPIHDYPHSAYLSMTCSSNKAWMCGGSIVNQYIVLTAAHCLRTCTSGSSLTRMSIDIGSTHKNKGIQKLKAQAFIVHEDYDAINDINDIGLIRVMPQINFGSTVSRIAIMDQFPPHIKSAQIAGWGLTDEVNHVSSVDLQKLPQVLWSKHSCENIYGYLPKGTFCASSKNPHSYVAPGDSGSALVVYGYIQIGLVSFKVPSLSKTLIVYSNVSYFYDWIALNSRRLFCKLKDPVLLA